MKDRRIEIDICKCICILGMIIVHSFETFSMFAAASTTAQYIILNILNTIFGAGSFMFCMAMSINYSRHNSSRDLIIRGLKNIWFRIFVKSIKKFSDLSSTSRCCNICDGFI